MTNRKHSSKSDSLAVLVVGATGGTGRAVVRELLDRGHRVTAFARRPESLDIESDRLTRLAGDALISGDVRAAVAGHDAVCVVLGNRGNPLAVRLGLSRSTAADIRSAGTANVIAAMREHGVERLLVQTTYGVGDSRGMLPLKWRFLFSVFLKPQIDDTAVQEELVKQSKLDWTLLQPVALTDEPAETEDVHASTEAQTASMSISRSTVARVFADALERARFRGRTVALSARAA